MGRMVSVLFGKPVATGGWFGPVAALALGYSPVVETLLLDLAVVAGVVVMGFVLLLLRRKYHPKYAADEDDTGFSMDRLERLRREGEISDEEFRRLRRVALGLDIPAAQADNASSSSSPGEVDAEGVPPGDRDSEDGIEKDDE